MLKKKAKSVLISTKELLPKYVEEFIDVRTKEDCVILAHIEPEHSLVLYTCSGVVMVIRDSYLL